MGRIRSSFPVAAFLAAGSRPIAVVQYSSVRRTGGNGPRGTRRGTEALRPSAAVCQTEPFCTEWSLTSSGSQAARGVAYRAFSNRTRKTMKFISSWTIPPGNVNPAIERFLKTGGKAPEGVKMLGRWFGMDGRAFAVSEATDVKAMYQWYAEWADLLELTVTPCVEDAEAGPVLAALAKR